MKTLITIITIFLLTFSNTFALNEETKTIIDTSKMDKVELDFYNKTKTIVDKINNTSDVSKIDINDVIWLFNKWYKNYWYNKEIKKAWEKYLDQPLFWVDNAKFLMSQWNIWNILEILNDKTKFDKLPKWDDVLYDKTNFYWDIYEAYTKYDEKILKAKLKWQKIFDGKVEKEKKRIEELDSNGNYIVSINEINKKIEYSTIQYYRINDYLNKLYAKNLLATATLKNKLKKDYSSYSKNLENSNQLSKIVKDIILIEQYDMLYYYHIDLVDNYQSELQSRSLWLKTRGIDELFE